MKAHGPVIDCEELARGGGGSEQSFCVLVCLLFFATFTVYAYPTAHGGLGGNYLGLSLNVAK